MTRKRTDIPFEFFRKEFIEIPPNLPLPKGGVLPPFRKACLPVGRGDRGGLFVTASLLNCLFPPPSSESRFYRWCYPQDFWDRSLSVKSHSHRLLVPERG